MRDGIRHVLALVLMAGTLAGTVWTFSNGALTLNGALERLVSVGGIAAALECGVIYCGWYIGQLDIRIQAARKRDLADGYRAYQRDLYRWFYVVAGISAVANLVFRIQQLDNFPLALFVALAPLPLIILYTVKLRPLPQDYEEMGRQTALRSLVTIQEVAGEVMVNGMRRMARGQISPDDLRQVALAASFVMPYAPTDQQHALGHALAQQGADGPHVIEGSIAERWFKTKEVASLYQISERSAQLWVSQTPGRRKVVKGNGWEVPASALYAARGVPPTPASPAPIAVEPPPEGAPGALVAAVGVPEGVYQTL